MKDLNKFKLTREKRDDMVAAIKRYFQNEREEELGDLAANLLLTFIMDELAPEFYNKGVQDAQAYMYERLEDMLSIQK